MQKCSIDNITLQLIEKKVARVCLLHNKEHGATSTLKSNIKNLLQDLVKDNFELGLSLLIAEAINKIAVKYQVIELVPDFFNVLNINNMLIAAKNNILMSDPTEASSDQITDIPLIRSRIDASRDFIDKSFGLAKEIAIQFQNIANQNLFDCLFINRGSINLRIGIVRNNRELNDNIRNYQELLLKNIQTYFKNIFKGHRTIHLEDGVKLALRSPLYDENNKYTGVLETLLPLIDAYIKQPLLGKTDAIREIYNASKDSNDPNQSIAKLKLAAFNSMILLNNFDTYLSIILGKSIQIKDFNLKTGEDKYQIATKTAKLATTWRISDNIFIEDEADSITKLAINTTPLYNWGSNVPKEGYYLSFSNFQHIIAKIKDLTYNPETARIFFDRRFLQNYSNLYNKLPKELKGLTLKALIANIRRNPKKYLNVIFDILSDNNFKTDNIKLYSSFTLDELNKLYSLNVGVFNGINSIRNLVTKGANVDYYSFITQSADSIFNVKYIQYYKDEDGKVQVRTLLDLGINNIKRKIELTINISNSINLIGNWEKYKQSLDLKVKTVDDNLHSIIFKIPETDIYVRVMANSGDVSFSKDYTQNFLKVLPFIDKILKLNLQNNIDLLNALKDVFKSTYEVETNLLKFASRVIFNLYVSKQLLSDLSLNSKMDLVNRIYGRNAPAYNWELDELGMVHGNDIRTLNNIALAKSNMDGITTSTQVKDGEGNGQSNQTFSRLLGSFMSQWELQEKSENSISNSFLLLTNPEILEGVFTAKEFYNPSDTSKPVTKMNVNEMTYSLIVYDFIGGLMQRDDNNVVGNGHIMILPSINSDKPTIGRLKINSNAIVYLGNGISKPLKDCNSSELETLISLEFGEFYEKMYNKITSDWNIVEDYMVSKGYLVKGLLASDFINGFFNFNNIFSSLNTGYVTPKDFIKAIVLEYNQLHRLHPLELVDQIHYKELGNTGLLSTNSTIIAQIARFKPNSIIFLGNDVLSKYPTSQQFWRNKKAEVLKSLLKYNFKINVDNSNQTELRYINDNYKNWVNSSGNLILAKVNVNGKIVDIVSNKDLLKLKTQGTVNDRIDNISDILLLNPILELYNYLDYLISQEYINLTVGSFVAHPEKSKSLNVLDLEAAQFLAQLKRNVSFTAAMHEFQLNLLNGIPEYYNIATIEDIKDIQGIIQGLNCSIKPFDGATFVNPFIVLLENYSLGGAKAGVTKKQFVHFKNESTGTAGIIKTAGFGLTNDWIRNSPFLQKMMEKMTNHVWLEKDGTTFVTDITKNWNGEKINYKKFFFKRDGKLYQITNIKNLGNNIYERTIQEVTTDGNPVTGELIIENNILVNTNFGLWNFFGGKDSMELKNNKLASSNTSVENVVIAMNSIGTPKSNDIQTLDDVWQALKMVDVHYVTTAGAVKQGAANINSASKYSDDVPYDIQRIHMYQAGILLDKEHHADDSDLSLMTLVISACAAKGYTIDTAILLYDAIRKSTIINTKEHVQAMLDLFTDGTDKSLANFREVMMKSIVKALATSNGNNFAKTIALDLMEQAKSGKKISYSDAAIPLSDNNIYRKVFSTVSSFLTRSGIRLKIPGVLSVLTPSHEVMKIYAGRKYESFNNPTEELEILQLQQVPVFDINNNTSNITNIELGRTYLITRIWNEEIPNDDGTFTTVLREQTLSEPIITPKDYQKLKRDIANKEVTRVVEDVRVGRNLAGYNVRFNTDKGSFQIWDLSSASALFELNELEKHWTGTLDDINSLKKIIREAYGIEMEIPHEQGKTYLDAFKYRLRKQLQNDLKNLSKTTPDIIEQYNELLKTSEKTRKWFNKYAQWVNVQLDRNDGNAIKLNGRLVTVTEDNIQEVHSQVLQLLRRAQQVRINGEWHTIDKNSLKELAYEIIMPKVFATKFGLDEFADLDTIQNDEDYFIKLYLRNQATQVNPNLYTIEFKKSDGKHIYLLNSRRLPGSGLIKLSGIITTVDEEGVTYRLDSNGNTMYEITPDTEIYLDNLGNEVIVSDDFQHYINELSYDSIKLSNELGDENYAKILHTICDNLLNSSNKRAKYFGSYITSYGNSPTYIMLLNTEYHNVNLENYKQLPDTNPIIRAGREKHTSFLRSLDIVAARIPAQNMLSYMPMKVVAFDNPDINTAYVSTYQLLLQGSDFDIDSVSLATFDVDSNGMLLLWSPYFNIKSIEMLKASETLPMPTDLTIKIQESDNLDNCTHLFKKYGYLFNIKPYLVYNKETKEYIPDKTRIAVTLNISTPQQLIKFGEMLKEILVLNKPSDGFIPQFMKVVGNLYDIKNKELFDDLFKLIKLVFDNHNLYLDKVHKSKLSSIVNNYTLMSMYNIIKDPVNLIQAQTPIDASTKPLKDIADDSDESKEAKNRTPGNFVNKYLSIIENQVGKEAIGICAIGLKAFFGLTLYNNLILNYGTAEQLARLLIGKTGILVDGKVYKTLANIRSKDPNKITNADVLEALSQVNNDYDACVVLSALLSLATDNAKELSLSKLNASTKTIGMYIYGITIGMDFRDIAKILMSPTGILVNLLLEGNVFTNEKETKLTKDIFKYFYACPHRLLDNYDVHRDLDGNSIPFSPLLKFVNLFKESEKLTNKDSIYESITKFANSNLRLQDKLNTLESFRNKYNVQSKYAKSMFNLLIDEIEDYVLNISRTNYNILLDIETLADGAAEMRDFGQILSLNQGIKTDPEGFLMQVNLIERAIYNRTGKDYDILDLRRFAFDEQYRQEAINKYDEVKHSFNILEAAVNVPHFLSYILLLAISLEENSLSFKFRSSRSMSLELSQKLEYNDENKIIKGIENYVGDYLRKQWFLLNNITIVIPKGNQAFDSHGNKYTLTQDIPVNLGTDWGAATFRIFVESLIIPDLQAGRIKPNVEFPGVKDNKFIRDLSNDISTKTVSKNVTILYTLPINMLPRAASDEAILNAYKAEFNKLAKYSYLYEVNSFNQDGQMETNLSKPIPLVDLFTYYAMIANSWKLSENSLVPILENFLNAGIIKDFHNFEKAYDNSGETLSLDNINDNDILPYVAPKNSPYTAYSKYIWARNSNTHKYELMRRVSNLELEDFPEDEFGNKLGVINNYTFRGSYDTNYFPTGNIEESSKTIFGSYKDGDKKVSYSITYNIETGIITEAHSGSTPINLKEIPVTKVNGIKKVDTNLLESIVKDQLNPC